MRRLFARLMRLEERKKPPQEYAELKAGLRRRRTDGLRHVLAVETMRRDKLGEAMRFKDHDYVAAANWLLKAFPEKKYFKSAVGLPRKTASKIHAAALKAIVEHEFSVTPEEEKRRTFRERFEAEKRMLDLVKAARRPGRKGSVLR